jgi:hypothetical protein
MALWLLKINHGTFHKGKGQIRRSVPKNIFENPNLNFVVYVHQLPDCLAGLDQIRFTRHEPCADELFVYRTFK